MNIGNDWPTKDKDLAIAEAIVNRHVDLNDGDPLGILEVQYQGQEGIDIKMADWVMEIADYCVAEYGDVTGKEVWEKILSRYMIGKATIH